MLHQAPKEENDCDYNTSRLARFIMRVGVIIIIIVVVVMQLGNHTISYI